MTKRSIWIKRILGAVWWLTVAMLALVLVLIISAKLQGKVPDLFGYSVMQIVTGSMEDEIPTGTYILTKRTDPEKIKAGDIISFYSDEEIIYGLPNTHRVVEVVKGDGGIEFVTRGDANPTNDGATAKADKLIGVYVGPLDWLGSFNNFLNNGGMIAIMAVLWFATFAIIAVSMYKKIKAEQKSADAPHDGE